MCTLFYKKKSTSHFILQPAFSNKHGEKAANVGKPLKTHSHKKVIRGSGGSKNLKSLDINNGSSQKRF